MITRLVLGGALAVFVWRTVEVLCDVGYLGFFEAAQANSTTRLLLLDVSLFAILVSLWMWREARNCPVRVAPFIALTLLFGAAGPLCYFLFNRSTHSGSGKSDSDATT